MGRKRLDKRRIQVKIHPLVDDALRAESRKAGIDRSNLIEQISRRHLQRRGYKFPIAGA